MKYLKYTVGFIALLLLFFIGRGFLTPSISYESEITVDKSTKEAWAVMNDESKINEWLKGITNIKHISGEKGEVGAVTQYTFSDNGQESIILETIKSITPNEQISMDFVMEGVMKMDYKLDFVDNNGKTLIKSSTTNKGEGIFMKSMIPFMKSSMKTQEDNNMNNLKKLIEENTTNYFPETVTDTIE
ncbi:MAG: hypothetical protein COA67_04940 [Lutibacter sp.]|nr:MAG: hypothetical protein COA67_04940 [Lutibacter sp.]